MTPRCARLFEAEALRDGRLAGGEQASYERHLGVCAECAREVGGLRALGDALKANAAAYSVADELHARRERTRLLAAFDSALVPPERRKAGRLRFAGLAAMAAMAATVALFTGLYAHRAGDVAEEAEVSAAAVVVADGGASWSRQLQGAVETIRLEQGALSIRVESAVPGHRLLVVLPDGELEDIGTTFTVKADAGRTAHVSVQSGKVVLRLRGRSPLLLGPGQTWTPDVASAPSCSTCERAPAAAPSAPPPASSRSVFSTPAAQPPQAATAAPSAVASARSMRISSPRASASVFEAPLPSQPVSDAALEFRAAVGALEGGDNGAAAARFAAFLAAYPSDSRAEDAAYLRVIALQRVGNAVRVREAARQYLHRYPRGFRRAEVEALTR